MLFPLLLAALAAGWGLLLERACDRRLRGTLVLPAGAAALTVLAGVLTLWDATAPLATPACAALALAGLLLGRREHRRIERWSLLAAVGILLAYGAPVILSGQATFSGFLRLDDTATFLGFVDQFMAHGRSFAHVPQSTFRLVNSNSIDTGYPAGSFLLLGVAHGVLGGELAWLYQPYLAFCASLTGLACHALLAPLRSLGPRGRALLAFVAAQSALLYGYAMWGGIKELTLAFMLALVVALALGAHRQARPRELLALGAASGAFMDAIGPGGAAWIVPLLAGLCGVWLWRGGRAGALRPALLRSGALTAVTLLCALPAIVVLSQVNTGAFFSTTDALGNLVKPLSPFQLAGVWPTGDFRLTPQSSAATVVLCATVLGSALWLLARVRSSRGVALATYALLSVFGCLVIWLTGGTPWVIAKALAVASPAVLLAGLAGASLLSERRRGLGLGLIGLITCGVLWSNVLAYHRVLLAPRVRLAELSHIDNLLGGHRPTWVNQYDVYADRHFLRDGAPTSPSEYRPITMGVITGQALTKAAWADLDSFSLATLAPFRSLVLRTSPVASRPSSLYGLVWRGRYYELWQQRARPPARILSHLPFGDSVVTPYCGQAQGVPTQPLCSVSPVAIPSCAYLTGLGRTARRQGAQLLAAERPAPIVRRADTIPRPPAWPYDRGARSFTALGAGTAITSLTAPATGRYRLWLGGSFATGFDVGVDGRQVATVATQINNIGEWSPAVDLQLDAGRHAVTLRHRLGGLAPGAGADGYTVLDAIALEPLTPPASLVELAPSQARRLCGQPLDWVELVS
ncbi:MAG: hypothetical protein NVSMB51_07750 [Solirubrobacteraceae bacterium]